MYMHVHRENNENKYEIKTVSWNSFLSKRRQMKKTDTAECYLSFWIS
jgi:hypothetical protein